MSRSARHETHGSASNPDRNFDGMVLIDPRELFYEQLKEYAKALRRKIGYTEEQKDERYLLVLKLLLDMGIDEQIEILLGKFLAEKTPEDVVNAKLSQITRRLFPPNPLPTIPPELWSDDSARRFKTPRDFVETIYEPWFKTELSWPYLYKNDRPVYNALRYQLTKASVSLNSYLPSKSALVKRDLEQAGRDGLKQAMRRVRAMQRQP